MTDRVLIPKLGQNINKKRRNVYVATFILTFLLFVFQIIFRQSLNEVGVVLVSGIFGIITVALGVWVLKFKGNIILFAKVFLLPFLLMSVFTFTLRQIFFSELERVADLTTFVGVLIVYAAVVYAVLLSANILYISDKKSIPLVQVAHTTWYILTLAVVFIFTYWSFVASPPWYLVLPVLILVYFLLVLQHISHFELSNKAIISKSIGITLSISSVVAFLAFWPTENWIKASAATLFGYVGMGVVMHEIKKVLDSRVIVEYSLLVAFIIFLIIITADWGIFGKLFS